jgi:hypothetical protein
MKNLEAAGQILRKIFIFTLVGFLVVVLSGPFLTLLGVLLPFALVGFLVWIPLQGIRLWRQGGWQSVRRAGGQAVRTVLAVPLWLISRAVGGAYWLVSSVFSLLGFVLGIVFPTLAGAFLGAVLGLIGGIEHQDLDVRIPAGALIGAGIGFLAGATRSRQRVKVIRVVVNPAPQVTQHA